MGCTTSRVVADFMDTKKESKIDIGTPSELDQVVAEIETKTSKKVKKIVGVQYQYGFLKDEKSGKSEIVSKCWTIEVEFEDASKEKNTWEVTNEKGKITSKEADPINFAAAK